MKALISVSNKENIVALGEFLASKGVEILSTGGTAKALQEAGVDIVKVSDFTGFPEILDGRVKTLQPKIHGGILAKNTKDHNAQLEQHGIERIDIVVVNLYPFEQTLQSGADFDTCIENIDIGGPAMVRASAKNHENVIILTNPNQYDEFIANFDNVSAEFRKNLAQAAFKHTSEYDWAISHFLAGGIKSLRYGENPHQPASLIITDPKMPSVVNAKQTQGKELSYNNIADADAAFELASEFDEPCVAIIKHANPCGIAIGTNLAEAYDKALACDSTSAFGGIFAFNKEVTADVAEKMAKMFAEVVIAPSVSNEAKELFAKKKNLRVLETGELLPRTHDGKIYKTVNGGLLVQERDNQLFEKLETATKREPTATELTDLKFAFAVCKHVKSNAIVYVKDGATIGIGAGQMSRVDSAEFGALKAKKLENVSLEGAVMASDAFLPFSDGLEKAVELGVKAVIQPGGSMRDNEVIDCANENNVAMIFTGTRHFRH